MKSEVVGAADLIGSQLSDPCIAGGHDVIRADSFTDPSTESVKKCNPGDALSSPRFDVPHAVVPIDAIDHALNGADKVFDQTGQHGVRGSWGSGPSPNQSDNLRATPRFLAHVSSRPLTSFSCAASSLTHGNHQSCPTPGVTFSPQPSADGGTRAATKLLRDNVAAHLDVPSVSLPAGFGTRQCPEMAMHHLIDLDLGTHFTAFGANSRFGHLTYVSGVAEINHCPAKTDTAPDIDTVMSDGNSCSIDEPIDIIGDHDYLRTGSMVFPDGDSDGERCGDDIILAQTFSDWAPSVELGTCRSRQRTWAADR